jgi:hypothetical protein
MQQTTDTIQTPPAIPARPPALPSVLGLAFLLAACGGSPDAPTSLKACTQDVCGAPGTETTVSLTSFDHATDVLAGVVGNDEVVLHLDTNTEPLPARPCEEAGPVAELVDAWNHTAPVDPLGQLDVLDYGAPYHRLLVAFANAGATASIRVAPDRTTVRTIQPVCAPSRCARRALAQPRR